VPCRSLVVVGLRRPSDALYRALASDPTALEAAGIRALAVIGDAEAPGAIVHAVYAGHKYAREFDAGPAAYRRDKPFATLAEL
jgi:dimethylamine/trimethylamine dehydrogenase